MVQSKQFVAEEHESVPHVSDSDQAELHSIKEAIMNMLEEPEVQGPEMRGGEVLCIDDMTFEISTTGLAGHEMYDTPETVVPEPADNQKTFTRLVHDWTVTFQSTKVDKEYRSAHPGVTFEPYAFALAEMKAAEARAAARTIQEVVESAPLDAVFRGLDRESAARLRQAVEATGNGALLQAISCFTLDAVAQAAYGPTGGSDAGEARLINPRKMRQIDAALADPEITLGMLRELYVETMKTIYVVPLTSQASMTEAVLSDVREGRSARVTRER